MPGLAGIDDQAFVAAFQGLETRFQNAKNIPGYEPYGFGNIPAIIAFPGAFLFLILSAFQNWKTQYFKWICIAIVLFIAGLTSTFIYNLPANIEIFSAGDSSQIDVATIRKNFNEKTWLHANHFRALTTCLATFCMLWILFKKLNVAAANF